MRYFLFILCLAACSPIVTNRGHIPKDTALSAPQVGASKQDVQRMLGSPSSTSRFGEETWYYIQSRKEAHGFWKPEITDQQVIGVVFDTSGAVKEIVDYDINDRKEVVIVKEKTPTEGHSVGFLEQALGNVGRFNTGGVDHSPTPRGPGGR